ncbi:MAG: hypothetical protein V1793_07480 [Pseudomonadota bacterium]
MKILPTLVVYAAILAILYTGIVINAEPDEVEANASLICYACIGVN